MREIPRPVISLVGLAIGAGLYTLAGKLGEPWDTLLISLLFVALGVGAWFYAAGERWIQVLGIILALWGVVRAFLPQ